MPTSEIPQAALKDAMEAMTPFVRPFWAPDVRDWQESDGQAGSRYFGPAWLAEGEAWPSLSGYPMDFILQLDVASLPAPMSDRLGGEGLLQLFYCAEGDVPFPDDLHDLALVRRVFPGRDAGEYRAPPEMFTPPHAPAPSVPQTTFGGPPSLATPKAPAPKVACSYSRDKPALTISGWTQKREGPDTAELNESYDKDLIALGKTITALTEKHDLYEDAFGSFCYQGDKLGGWPFWTQGPEYASPGRPARQIVYQLDAGCFFDGPKVQAHAPALFSEDGTGHILVNADDPDDLVFSWACT